MKTTISDLLSTRQELTRSINRLTLQINLLRKHRARIVAKLRHREQADNWRAVIRRAKAKTI